MRRLFCALTGLSLLAGCVVDEPKPSAETIARRVEIHTQLGAAYLSRNQLEVAQQELDRALIPNLHCESFLDLSPEACGSLFSIAQKIAGALGNSSLRCEGINLVLADGEAAGQEVFHTHLHIIPRFQGDGFGFRFGNRYFNRPSRDELMRVADILQKGL